MVWLSPVRQSCTQMYTQLKELARMLRLFTKQSNVLSAGSMLEKILSLPWRLRIHWWAGLIQKIRELFSIYCVFCIPWPLTFMWSKTFWRECLIQSKSAKWGWAQIRKNGSSMTVLIPLKEHVSMAETALVIFQQEMVRVLCRPI